MTEETSLKHAIKDYLGYKGVMHWYNLAGMGAYKGLPDIFALHRGKLYGIEVKAPRGVVSGHQEAFLSKLKEEGGVSIVARSLDDVMDVIL